MELDELKKNLTQILETNPHETNNSEYIAKGFSFGKTGDQNNNPFENFLYHSNVNLKQEVNKHTSPEKKIINKIDEENEKSSGEKTEKRFNKIDETSGNNQKNVNFGFEKKPPLSFLKNSSLKNLKQMDNSLKNDKEYERMANIMKGNFGNSKKFYDFSSDSDA